MQNKKLAGSKPPVSTQQYLDIAEIKEDVVILKDGTLRGVIMVSSVNFALKSEDEQAALISSYVNFLNSLKYPIQIAILSRKLNMEGYIMDLKQKAKDMENQLLKTQIVNYTAFINELIEIGDIMTKKFYVVVPYSSLEDKTKTFFQRVKEVINPAKAISLKSDIFMKYKNELDIRVNQIAGSMQSMGLNSVRLDTQSLIELYYVSYNPSTAEAQKMTSINDIRVEHEF